MTTKELEQKVKYHWKGYGTYLIKIEYRNDNYECTSHNTLAVDRITGSDDWNSEYEVHCGYTYKQALEALYDECKRKNRLGRQYNEMYTTKDLYV